MRWSWLRAVILGTVIGPAPVLADLPDVEEPSSGESIGHVVQGPNFHVWDEDSREVTDWAIELIRAGGKTPEVERWQNLATTSAALTSLSTDELEAELATLSEVSGGDHSISTLGRVLCLLPSLDRTALICSWATSTREETRRELALALSAPFEAVGLRGALDHLQGDPSPEVRRLARFAAASRQPSLG